VNHIWLAPILPIRKSARQSTLEHFQHMKPGPDPFGFDSAPPPASSAKPITVKARPGQEIRIVIDDPHGTTGGSPDSSRGTPSPSPDSSRGTPSPGPDSSRGTPSPSPDALTGAAFGFESRPQTFSPQPLLIVAQPGQEVLIVAENDSSPAAVNWADSSRGTPSPSPDRR
jgi:hypothetical protein